VIPPAVVRVKTWVAAPTVPQLGTTQTQLDGALPFLAVSGLVTGNTQRMALVPGEPPASGEAALTADWDSGTTMCTPLGAGRPDAEAIPPAKPAPAPATSTAHTPIATCRLGRRSTGASGESAITSG